MYFLCHIQLGHLGKVQLGLDVKQELSYKSLDEGKLGRWEQRYYNVRECQCSVLCGHGGFWCWGDAESSLGTQTRHWSEDHSGAGGMPGHALAQLGVSLPKAAFLCLLGWMQLSRTLPRHRLAFPLFVYC